MGVLKEIRLLHQHINITETAAVTRPPAMQFQLVALHTGMNTLRLLSLIVLLTFLGLVNGKFEGSNRIDADVSQVDYASMEIRTAINYQTEAIGTVLKNLTQVKRKAVSKSFCIDQNSDSQVLNEQLTSSNLIPQVLDGLKSVGELGSQLRDASSTIQDMKSKMLTMESSVKQLRRETKRAKKEEAALRTSLEALQSVVDAVQGGPVYFDASR